MVALSRCTALPAQHALAWERMLFIAPATGQWKCLAHLKAAQLWVALPQDAAYMAWRESLGPHWQLRVMQRLNAFAPALDWEDSQALWMMLWAAQAAAAPGASLKALAINASRRPCPVPVQEPGCKLRHGGTCSMGLTADIRENYIVLTAKL